MVSAEQARSISQNELTELWLVDVDRAILQAATEHAHSAVFSLGKNTYLRTLDMLVQKGYEVVCLAENALTVTLRVFWNKKEGA